MGIFDFLTGNQAAPQQGQSGDAVGNYLGNLIDPATAEQFARARAQEGLLGLSIGLLQGSGPSRLPVPFGSALGAGLAGMSQLQSALPQQALQSAQTGNAVSEGLLKKLQAAQLGYQLSNMPNAYKALAGYNAGGGDGTGGGGSSAGGVGGKIDLNAPTVSSTTADSSLPVEARALLDTISGPESKGAYNIRYTPKGGATFDSYDRHPEIYEPGPEGPSSAAGRYQMVYSTYAPIAAELGQTDFSPKNQDQAAWHLAQTEYARKTGGDLLTDLKAGKLDQVSSALAGQWATLRGGIGAYGGNLNKYLSGGADTQTASAPNGAAAPGAGFDLAVGDSIAKGLNQHARLGGTYMDEYTMPGADKVDAAGSRKPQQVLDYINGNLKKFAGKTVFLSSGIMNGPDQIDLVPQQIDALQKAGARVVLAGADKSKDFADTNLDLADIANEAKIPFAGALPTNNVHPGANGYRQYASNAVKLIPQEASGSSQPGSAAPSVAAPPQGIGDLQNLTPGLLEQAGRVAQLQPGQPQPTPATLGNPRPGLLAQAAGGAPVAAPQVSPQQVAPQQVAPQQVAPQQLPQPQAGSVGTNPALPYGYNTARIQQARNTIIALTQAGLPVPDYLKEDAKLNSDIARAAGTAQVTQQAEAAYAFPKALGAGRGKEQAETEFAYPKSYGTTAGAEAAKAPNTLIDTTINGRDVKIPLDEYLKLFRQTGGGGIFGPIMAPGTSPSAPTGNGILPSVAQGGPPAPQMPAGAPNAGPGGYAGPVASPAPSGPVAAPGGLSLGGASPLGGPMGGAPMGVPPIGKLTPNPTYQSAVEKLGTEDSELMTKTYIPEAQKGAAMINTAQLIKDLLPQVKTGWGAGSVAQGAKILSALGASDDAIKDFLGTNPTFSDVLQKKFLEQSSLAVRELGAREPGSVISLFGKAYPGLPTQKNAIELMENVLAMQAKWSQDRLAAANQHRGEQVENLRNNKPYAPLSQFDASIPNGPLNANLYLKAAEAMSGLGNVAWRGLSRDQQNAVYNAIPVGSQYVRPDGRMDVKR